MKLVKSAKISYIIASILMIAMGLLLIIAPDLGGDVVIYIVGGLTILFGIVKIMGYFSKDLFRLAFQFDLSLGILAILLGILVMAFAGAWSAIVPYIFGVYAIIDGIAKLQTSIDAKRFGFKNWWFLVILAVFTCAAGVLAIMYNVIAEQALWIMLGIALLCDGIENLCTVIYTVKVFKNYKKVAKEAENIIDGDKDIVG